MIELVGLSKIYSGREDVKAVSNINLHINQGEIFGIIGPSGAGKSTLLRCINLLEKPTEGKVLIDGLDLTTLSQQELRKARQKMGMIFQHFNLLSSRTVAENVEFPLEILKISEKKRKEKVKELLTLVGLEDRADHYPSQLSGGQKQRVGIARALASDPKVLLCDEATSALDPKTTEAILNLIRDINQRLNLTVVLITHEMDVIRKICHRVAVMDSGKIVEVGKVKDIFINPESRATKELLGQVQLNIAEDIISTFREDGKVLKITFIGPSANEPIIFELIEKYRFIVNIIAGNIEQVQGDAYGELLIEVKGSCEKISEAIDDLKKRGLKVEVVKNAGNVL